MKRTILVLALMLASGAGGLAFAQPAPEPQSQPGSPSSSSTSPAAGATNEPTLMKQCLARQQERAASSGMSRKDIEELCKNQVKSELQTQAPR
jgi:hypothetical protein